MALTFYSDPRQAYEELAATVPEGQKFTQSGFDYEGKSTLRIEDIYPNVSLFDPNGTDAWQMGQGAQSDCMELSSLCGLAASTGPYTVKDIIYPNTPSPIGLYLVSIADGLDRKWFPIDSFVPTNNGKPINARGVDGGVLWPALVEKAAATLRGNSYAGLHHSVVQAPNFYWIPSVNVAASTFEDVLAAVQMGGYGRVDFTKRLDAAGVEIKTPGIVLDHAYGLVAALQVGDHKLIRLSNPWIAGVDYASPLYADDAPFWAENNLLDKVSATYRGGEFWIGWDEFLSVGGRLWSSQMRIPLPHPQLPHSIAFDAEFTDTNAVVGNWPSVKSLRPLNQSLKITLTEETDLAIAASWQPGGSGPRHIFVYVTNGVNSTELMPRGYGWWGGDGFTRKKLPAGTYEITPACPDCTARGTVQFIILSSKPVSV